MAWLHYAGSMHKACGWIHWRNLDVDEEVKRRVRWRSGGQARKPAHAKPLCCRSGRQLRVLAWCRLQGILRTPVVCEGMCVHVCMYVYMYMYGY